MKTSQPGKAPRLSFRLYVAGESPNTRRAQTNLRQICESVGHQRYELTIVDVLKEPRRALADGVLVAPTLIKLAPGPVRRIIGDLSNRDAVLTTLDLPETVT